jgi:hypothetical protein
MTSTSCYQDPHPLYDFHEIPFPSMSVASLKFSPLESVCLLIQHTIFVLVVLYSLLLCILSTICRLTVECIYSMF